MKNSRIISFLKSLSKDEMKKFGKYIVYKSTNRQSKLLDFYNYLKKYHPKFPENHIDKKRIAKKLYPTENETKGLKNINNLIFWMTPLLKDFMIQIELNKQEEQKKLLYLEALKSRKIEGFFRETDRLEKDWQKDVISGIEHLLNLYRLKKMRFDHPGFLNQSEFPLQPNIIIKQLEQFFIAEKLYWTLNGHFTSIFLKTQNCNENEQPIPMEKLVGEVERKHLAETKQIELLTKIFNAVALNDTVQYEEIERVFFENYKLFDSTEVKELFTFLTQICYKNHQEGKKGALFYLFRINKFATEHKLLFKNEMVSSDVFHNVVNIALAANELDWTKKFIDEYESFIQESERNDAVALSKTKYHFYCDAFEKALDSLLKLKYVTIFYDLQGRSLELQIYFEMKDVENFGRAKSVFKDYLWRKEREGILTEEQKTSLLNFIEFIDRLNEFIFKRDREELKRLQSDIDDCSLLANKAWLTKKVALYL